VGTFSTSDRNSTLAPSFSCNK